ncbi:MAG: hypothetical protein WD341_06250 [Tistlia sp.]|uniref:hypothetical protein n=1 Tax=Tistlia sp. TaxID=3057121 RepID=UPI0034A53BDB
MILAATTTVEHATRRYWEAASVLAGRHRRPASLETARLYLHQLAGDPLAPRPLALAAHGALRRHYRAGATQPQEIAL